jgi:hypothetical protein
LTKRSGRLSKKIKNMSKIESGSFGEESKEPQIIDSELDKVSQEELKTGKISRRNFLRGALAIGATTAVSSVIGAEKPETDKERLAQEMEALRREAFEFIKETIEKEKIREKLEYLEQTYGNLVNGLFGDVKKVIEITDQIEKDDKDGWEGIFVDKDSPETVHKSVSSECIIF